MRDLINIAVFIFSISMLVSCIEEYTPDIEADESNKYVVSGQLTTEQEYQTISVAIVSSIGDPKIIPLNDCTVRIVDSNGNSFEGKEFGSGNYKVRVPPEFINTGKAYRLEIITPAGTNLVSGYEELFECPDIDSIYFVRENKPTNDPEEYIEGVQFYLNLNAQDMKNAFYRFDIVETYEYHSLLTLEWYYDGILHHIIPRDSSHYFCWVTEKIRDIFILNTAELQYNAYKKFPLHFVDNTTQRLAHLYSILVKQYAISKQQYVFWDQLRINNIEQGDLYETQPLPVLGNLKNITNPNQSVLGYFQVSSVKTKRIFIKDIPDLELKYEPDCGIYLLRKGLVELTPDIYQYPVYLLLDGWAIFELAPECIFCEMSGGTTTRPDYWPDQQ